jgi:ribosomal protein S18 acetylase RimI-like enzyme
MRNSGVSTSRSFASLDTNGFVIQWTHSKSRRWIPDRRFTSSGMTNNRKSPAVSATRKPTLNIRPATLDDAKFILSLAPRFVTFDLPRSRRKRDVVAALRADLEHALREKPASDRFFIAGDADGKPVGFLHLQVQRDFFSHERACHVSDIAVAAGSEGRGVGHMLLEHAQRWAKQHRCRLLTLSVFPGNVRARALYESVGFVPDLLRMVKPLR